MCRPQAEPGPLPWQCTHFDTRGQAQSLLRKRGWLTGGHGHCPQGHSSPQRLLTSGPWTFQAWGAHQRGWGHRGSHSSGQAAPPDEACPGWDVCKLQCHLLLPLCCSLSGPGTSVPLQPGPPDAPGSRGLFPRTPRPASWPLPCGHLEGQRHPSCTWGLWGRGTRANAPVVLGRPV